MKLIEILGESRKNPEKNKKPNVTEIVRDLIKQAKESNDIIAGTPNVFITMTDINKVGINPGTNYETPIGIYFWIANKFTNFGWGGSSTPTATGDPGFESGYVNIFRLSGNIINLRQVTQDQVDKLKNDLIEVIRSKTDKFSPESISKILEKGNVDFYGEPGEWDNGNILGPIFYSMPYVAAKMLSSKNVHIMWSSLFKKCGIDGIIDYDGIFYESSTEMSQGVVFSTSNIVRGSIKTFGKPTADNDSDNTDDMVLGTKSVPANNNDSEFDYTKLKFGDVVKISKLYPSLASAKTIYTGTDGNLVNIIIDDGLTANTTAIDPRYIVGKEGNYKFEVKSDTKLIISYKLSKLRPGSVIYVDGMGKTIFTGMSPTGNYLVKLSNNEKKEISADKIINISF
jgi:hypothetical protein